MAVQVGTGAAWIQGRHYNLYGQPMVLEIPDADTSHDRIDRVVVRMDTGLAARTIEVYVKVGTPGEDPEPPSLERNSDAWEISLAQVFVEANASEIDAGDITDERYDLTLCGFVYARQAIEVANVDELRAMTGLPHRSNVILHGYHEPGDGGGGVFWVDRRDTSTSDNGGTVFVTDDGARIKRIYSDRLNILWFGAKRDGSADIWTPFINALNALPSTGGEIFFPRGTYLLNNAITVTKDGVTISGENRMNTRIWAGMSNLYVLRIGDGGGPISGCKISDITIENPNGNPNVTGIALYEARDCKVNYCGVYDCEVGIHVYGDDGWCSGCLITEPNIGRCKTGIDITADGGEANSTMILHGIITGWVPIESGSIGIAIRSGNTNIVVGTDIEDHATGLAFLTDNAGGNRAVFPRIENCDTTIYLGPGTKKTTILGATAGVVDDSGETSNLIIDDTKLILGDRYMKMLDMLLQANASDRLDLIGGDLKFDGGKGIILVDKTTTAWYRVAVDNGELVLELI